MAEARQRQAAAVAPLLNSAHLQVFEDFRKTMQLHNDAFQAISLPYRQLAASMQAWQGILANSIVTEFKRTVVSAVEISINFERPQIVIPTMLEETLIDVPAKQNGADRNGPLTVSIDQFGSFIIGNRRMVRANAKTSRHGQLLKLLEQNKGHLVTKDDVKASILRTADPTQIMKDLNKELNSLGLKLVYEVYPLQGWVYKGVITQQ
jgi:hypothetical protein